VGERDPLSSVHVWPRAVLVPDALHADRSGSQTNLNRASVRLPPDHEVLPCATPDELLWSCSHKVGLLWVRLEIKRTRTAATLLETHKEQISDALRDE
jgi:hypothetical protein